MAWILVLSPPKAVAERISRTGGQDMGTAGLGTDWKEPTEELVRSLTMLTVKATVHPLIRNYHKATDENRMVAILPEDCYDAWLKISANENRKFLLQSLADELVSSERVVDSRPF